MVDEDLPRALDDVLTRMQGHVSKKTPQLRALRSWRHLAGPSR